MARRALHRFLHPKWTRAAKATARFLLLVGGLVSFAISAVKSFVENNPDAWTSMGLLLVCLAALFYDPENPPNMEHQPVDLSEDENGRE